jgi:hypothetical protein
VARQFDLSLIVCSGRLSLLDVATRLRREPEAGSHDKGDPRGLPASGMRWDVTVWRQNARNPDSALAEQCSQLLADMPPGCAELVAAEQDDISVYLDIAVYFNTAYLALTLPRTVIRNLAEQAIALEITGYPVSSDGEVKERGRGTGALIDEMRRLW